MEGVISEIIEVVQAWGHELQITEKRKKKKSNNESLPWNKFFVFVFLCFFFFFVENTRYAKSKTEERRV